MSEVTTLDAAARAELIAKIRALPDQLAHAVAGLSKAQLTTHFLPGEWSVAQNVHHLADSHMVCFVRIKHMLTEDQPLLLPYDPDLWADTAEANSPEIAPSLELLRGLHRRWADLFESLSEEQWQRVGVRRDRPAVRVVDLLRIYAGHGEAHLDQIRRTLAAQ